VIDALPRLAVGKHKRGSGQACIMNAISYLNGDTIITDMPSCTDPVLAVVAIRINDTLCTHRSYLRLVKQPVDIQLQSFVMPAVQHLKVEVPTYEETESPLLCSDCTARVWNIGTQIIGTSSVWQDDTLDRERIYLTLVVDLIARRIPYAPTPARQILVDLVQGCRGAIRMLPDRTWADDLVELLPAVASIVDLNTFACGAATLRLIDAISHYGDPGRGFADPYMRWQRHIEAANLAFGELVGTATLRHGQRFIDEWRAATGYTTVRDFTPEDIEKVRVEACLSR